MHNAFLSPKVKPDSGGRTPKAETVFLNLKGAQESIPPEYVARRAGKTTLFLLGC
jgi:hypothetical protein